MEEISVHDGPLVEPKRYELAMADMLTVEHLHTDLRRNTCEDMTDAC